MSHLNLNWKRKIRSKACFFILMMITSCLTFKSEFSTAYVQQNLQGVNVLVYNGPGNLESSRIALENMFRWMNATVNSVDHEGIKNGKLKDCDILVFPGGATSSYYHLLGEDGRELVLQFLKNGGSYFGICGGAQFALTLNLVEGHFFSNSPEVELGTYMMEMYVNQESTGPDLSEEPLSYSTLFWDSKYYQAEDMSGINPIMVYPHNNQPGMITFRYESGTVFISYPHPEYEENSDRDGTSDFDYFDDPDSEWDILLKVSRWLIDESPSINPDPFNPLPIVISLTIIIPIAIIGVVAGIIIVLLKRRS